MMPVKLAQQAKQILQQWVSGRVCEQVPLAVQMVCSKPALDNCEMLGVGVNLFHFYLSATCQVIYLKQVWNITLQGSGCTQGTSQRPLEPDI